MQFSSTLYVLSRAPSRLGSAYIKLRVNRSARERAGSSRSRPDLLATGVALSKTRKNRVITNLCVREAGRWRHESVRELRTRRAEGEEYCVKGNDRLSCQLSFPLNYQLDGR